MRLTAECPAKINLGLEVVGRRPDGYHELVTIFQAISLSDVLTVEPGEALTLTCSEPGLATADNLCLQAAALLRRATGTRHGAALHLTKRIPAAAGLGGGSSDAATALVLLNQLWQTGLPVPALASLAVGLGADVPFFLNGATALGRGIGDQLEPLPAPPVTWLVLVRPEGDIPGKTARLYRALTSADWTDGEATLAQARRLRTGAALDCGLLRNVFARPLRSLMPELAEVEALLRQAGATAILPAGSGPSLVALCGGENEAQQTAAAVKRSGYFVCVARTLSAR